MIKRLFLRENLKFLLFCFFPIMLFTCVGFFLYEDLKQYVKEVSSFILLYIAIYSIVFLLKNKVYRKTTFIIGNFILGLSVFIKLSFMNYYGSRLNASALYIIFETNSKESYDFLKNYLALGNIFLLVLSFSPLILFLITKNYKLIYKPFTNSYFKIFCILGFTLYIHQTKLRFFNEDLFFRLANSIEGYQMYKEGLRSSLCHALPTKIDNIEYNDLNETHVIIIGESTTKKHMELYEYTRKTNPLLTKIKSELLIFNDVISPHVHTITSLEKILTLNSFENEDTSENFSVVQLANAANFETYWISVQEPLGINENVPTLISNAANHRYFLESNNWHERVYDEKVLPKFKEVVNSASKRKVIFIHLMGTHVAYKKRYPEKFNFFKNQNAKSKFGKKGNKYINHYDNSIRYNDSIVNEIIQITKSKNLASTITYFSDHGQEVFNTLDYMGHDEYRPTTPMYEVPFIIWLSNKYKKAHIKTTNYNNFTSRKYILEDFPNTFSDILGVKFNRYDKNKSILSNDFFEKKRIIKNGKHYDGIQY